MSKLERRRFGRTELEIPAVTYGGGWVGGLLIRAEEDVAHGALDRAFGAGIDWFDTAAAYGDGISERVIGAWLKDRPADQRPRISTKFNVDPANDDLKGQVRKSLEDSLTRLGLERVEMLILHNRIVDKRADERGPRELVLREVLNDGGIATILDDLRSEGLIDWRGITGLGQPAAVGVVIDEKAYDAAQIYYNLLNPSAAQAVPASWNSTDFICLARRCQAADMGVMGIRIFAAGHLATDERHGREIPISENAEDNAEEARAAAINNVLGGDHGTRAQTALRFGLACEGLSTIVVGIGEPSHLEEVLEGIEMGPLPAEAIDQVSRLWERDAAFVGAEAGPV